MSTATIRRLVLVVLVTGALCAPVTGALAQAATPKVPAGLGVTLLEAPANTAGDPRAKSYIVDHLAPGTTISRKVGFSNGDAKPMNLTFYAAAALLQDGAFVPGAGHAANDLTSWTTFSPASATVQPGQTLPVTVTIAVPPQATAGERYAAALAENAPVSAGGGVASVSRAGIRIYLSVGPGGAPKTAFTVDTLTAQRDADGAPLVTAQVRNNGERAIDLSGTLELAKGPSSLSAGPFPVRSVATLTPGGASAVTVALDRGLPNGPWDAKMTLTSGTTSETVTARITFPDGSGTSSAPTGAVQSDSTTSPILPVAGGVAVLLAVSATVVTVRRRRNDPVLVASSPAGD